MSVPVRPRQLPSVPVVALAELVPGGYLTLPTGQTGEQVRVSGVTHDSRSVQPGDLYAALPGARAHGIDFVDQAVRAGAVAVLTDTPSADRARSTGLAVLATDDPRGRLGWLAAAVYQRPTERLRLFGVTGTNGKTTVAYLAEAGLRAAGHQTGLVGTVETRIGDTTVPSVRTTPEAPDLQALFAVMVERGVTAAAMEVSSHALALHRADGCRFAAAAFTNLSQDHLDFHPSMEDYFAAKSRLFEAERTSVPVIAVDDPYGHRLADALAGEGRPPVTFAVGRSADWRADDVVCAADGTTFRLRGPFGVDRTVRLRLVGRFNAANAVAAIALLTSAGVPLEPVLAGVTELAGVPGRLERVEAGQPFAALVDYAHTPEAVSAVLATVRELTHGRVIVALGCGGDRDPLKRPLMARAAAQGADIAVFTSDNPRSEDPDAILAAMLAGLDEAGGRAEVVVEPDRAVAIALAVRHARPGDVVLVAGKGHETGQEVAGVVTPFDDRVVLREALAELGSRAGSGSR